MRPLTLWAGLPQTIVLVKVINEFVFELWYVEICLDADCGYNAHKQCKDETAPNCQPTKQLVKRGRWREREKK